MLHPVTGILTVGAALDRETAAWHVLPVSVTDQGVPALQDARLLLVHVLDVNDEAPQVQAPTDDITVSEDALPGTVILTLNATDSDAGPNGTVAFAWQEQAVQADLELDAATGVVRVRRLDFERRALYDLVAVVSDGASPARATTARVRVQVADANDHSPQFVGPLVQGPTVWLSQTTPRGTVVATVTATDADSGPRGRVRFKLVAGQESTIFQLNGTSGQLVVHGPLPPAGHMFNLSILALDAGQPPRTSTLHVLLAVRAPVAPELLVTGSGLLLDNPASAADVSVQQTVSSLFPTAAAQQGNVTATLGTLRAHATINLQPELAVGLRAIALETTIWSDDPVVRVAVQTLDQFAGVPEFPTQLRLLVTPNEELGELEEHSEAVACSPNATTGLCFMSTRLPNAWFNDNIPLRDVAVSVGFADGRRPAVVAGNLTLARKAAHEPLNQLLVDLPTRTLPAGAVVDVPLWVHADHGVASLAFTLRANTTAVTLSHVTHDRNVWQLASHVAPDGAAVAVSGILNTPYLVPVAGVAQLGTVRLTVAANLSVDTPIGLTLELVQLVNVMGADVLQGQGAAGYLVDRTGLTTTGVLYASADSVRALFPVAQHPSLTNLAMLTGRRESTAVTVLGVRFSGEPVVLTSGVSCESGDDTVVQVDGQCRHVFVDGSETRGAEAAHVLVRYGSLQGRLQLRVLAPILPIILATDLPAMRRVEGLVDPARSCSPRYQAARVRATAHFSVGSAATAKAFDVTQLVLPHLRSSNEQVVRVAHDTGLLYGGAPGIASIELVPAGLPEIGQLAVQVTDAATVDVMGLDLLIITRLAVEAPPSLAQYSNGQVEARAYQDRLELDGSVQGQAMASVLYSDGTRRAVPVSELELWSADEDIAVVSAGGQVTGRGIGRSIIYAAWRPNSECPSAANTSWVGTAEVAVGLADIASLELAGLETLTHAQDGAALLAVQTELTVRVTARLTSGGTRDLTTDPGLQVRELGGPLLNVTWAAGRQAFVVTVSSLGAAGQAQLQANIALLGISITGTIHVVALQRVNTTAVYFPLAMPQPAVATTLRRVAGTGALQLAALVSLATLSNGATVDITLHPALQHTVTAGASLVSLAQKAGSRVVTATGPSVAGQVSMATQFGPAAAPLVTLQLLQDVAVTVVALTGPSLQSGSGATVQPADQLVVGARFNDGSAVGRLHDAAGQPYFPGLVRFVVDRPTVLAIESTTGITSLLANYHSTVSAGVQVTSGPPITASAALWCNLQPAVGDLDVGREELSPLASLPVQATAAVPVRFRAGSSGLDQLEFTLVLDANRVLVDQVSPGPSTAVTWAAVNASAVRMTVRPADAQAPPTSTPVVAQLQLRGVRAGSVSITASIDRVVTAVGALGPVPRPMVAGQSQLFVVNAGRRRRSAHGEQLQACQLDAQGRVQGHGLCDCQATANPPTVHVNCTARGLAALPSGLPSGTTALVLDNNAMLTSLPDHGLRALENLTTLSAQNAGLTSVGPLPFAGLPRLRLVDLRRNQLTALPSLAVGALDVRLNAIKVVTENVVVPESLAMADNPSVCAAVTLPSGARGLTNCSCAAGFAGSSACTWDCNMPGAEFVSLDPQVTSGCQSCTACGPRQYQRSACTKYADSECAACDASCASCDAAGPGSCTACADSAQVLFMGYCVTACPAGFVRDADEGACVACHDTCAACSGPSARECLTCADGLLLDTLGQCGAGCQSAADSVAVHLVADALCLPCAADLCTQCTDSTLSVCSACETEAVGFDGGCFQDCPPGAFWDAEREECASCPSTCLTCQNLQTCTACTADSVLQSGRCLPTCTLGWFQDPYLEECKPCRGACGPGEFEARGCSVDHDRVCSPCTLCAPGTYQAGGCQGAQDTVCRAFSACNETQYASVAGGPFTDVVCSACSDCAQQGFYAQRACTATADTTCVRCAHCAPDEYEVQACSATQDTVCVPCGVVPEFPCPSPVVRANGSATPPCPECMLQPQLGDVNMDCRVDVRDLTALLADTADSGVPAAAGDVTADGRVDVLDAYVLNGALRGWLRLLGRVQVQVPDLPAEACAFGVRAELLDVALDANELPRTFVAAVDLATPDMNGSVFVPAALDAALRRAGPAGGVVPLAAGVGDWYTMQGNATFNNTAVGVSILQATATRDAQGQWHVTTFFHTGSRSAPYTLLGQYEQVLPVATVQPAPRVSLTTGYNALREVASRTPSAYCANDFAPAFARAVFTITVLEDTPVGASLLNLSAADQDEGPNGALSFALAGSLPEFALSSRGELTLRAPLNYEAVTTYTLDVQVEDGGVTPRVGSAQVVVEVGDVNDNRPVFTQPAGYFAVVQENSAVGTVVEHVAASDADAGLNAMVRLALVSGELEPWFAFDADAGNFTVARQFDFEDLNQTRFAFRVSARDLGDPALSAEVDVVIDVADVNDNAPEFSLALYVVSLLENHPVGTPVVQTVATDRDGAAQNTRIYYRLRGAQGQGPSPAAFAVDQDSGLITLMQARISLRSRLPTTLASPTTWAWRVWSWVYATSMTWRPC